jgi:hypothetical protein
MPHIDLGGHHFGGGGGGLHNGAGPGSYHHLGGNHPHHGHHHHHHHNASFPFVFFPFSMGRGRGAAVFLPPPPPSNAILTVSASTDGKIGTQYFVPNEAADLLTLSELTGFVSQVNEVLTATTPSQLLFVIWTLGWAVGGVIIYNFVLNDDEGPQNNFITFVNCMLGFCFGLVVAGFTRIGFIKWQLKKRAQQVHSLMESVNRQTFVARGCHW